MRKSKRHKYRQAYNAQAVVDADGSQLVLVAGVSRSPSVAPTFEETIERLCDEVDQPDTVLADAGYAQEQASGPFGDAQDRSTGRRLAPRGWESVRLLPAQAGQQAAPRDQGRVAQGDASETPDRRSQG